MQLLNKYSDEKDSKVSSIYKIINVYEGIILCIIYK
jgi:hypothetical protein